MNRLEILGKQQHYVRNLFAKEDEALANVKLSLSEQELEMQIGPDEGKILQVLAKMINAKKIVEVGVLAGYSAIWMARALSDDGKIYAFEKNKKQSDRIFTNFKNCNVDNKISVFFGEALDELPKINNEGPFDMVFIDADKAGYTDYLDWAEANIRTGGLIIGDNTFLFGNVFSETCPDSIAEKSWKNMRKFNERLADETKYSSIIIPTIEGLTIAQKL